VEPLVEAGVPVLQGARASLLAIRRLFDYSAWEATKPSRADASVQNPFWAERLQTGEPLTEREAKVFLGEHGVPVTREVLTTTIEDAVAAAEALTYPVVLKVESADIAHKSDIGGVQVNLRSAEEVAQGFAAIMTSVRAHRPDASIAGILVQEMVSRGTEVIIGLSRQDPFGMAVVVGTGGVLVELVRDTALALAPLSKERAAALIRETKVGQLLTGYRGSTPGDFDGLCQVLVRLSAVAMTYGDLIEELDLNPVIVGAPGQGVRVVDALLVPRRTGSCA
jgi:acyl-CoA synthetase (NDP forming)